PLAELPAHLGQALRPEDEEQHEQQDQELPDTDSEGHAQRVADTGETGFPRDPPSPCSCMKTRARPPRRPSRPPAATRGSQERSRYHRGRTRRGCPARDILFETCNRRTRVALLEITN